MIYGILLLILLVISLFPYSVLADTINASSCSSADVQTAINSAVDGDIVAIPSCAATSWASGITISGKGIHVQGAGSGRIVAYSTSSVAVGTGTKVFTLNASGLSLGNGQTLRLQWLGDSSGWPGTNPTGRNTWMEGTVTSYSGTTLTMDITSTAGSGTHADWLVGTQSATTITHNSSGTLIAITYDATHPVKVSDFKIAAGSGNGHMFTIGGALTTEPGQIHDMWLEHTGSGDVFRMSTSRGLFYNLSIDASPFEDAELGWHVLSDGETSSWETASTFGASDTDGKRNIYIEDSDIHNWLHFSDFDNNARVTLRYNLIHQAAIGSHGQDTSDYGVRFIEVHNNTFVVASESSGYPLNYWLLQRGGTGVWTDNVVPDIRPSDGKVELQFGIYVLRESVSNNPCWGQDIEGIQYPAPRQIGFGYVTGTGVDGLGNSTYLGVYVGDSEPFYYWNNTGIATPAVGVDDTSDGGCTGALDSGADYFQSGRDYFINAGAKPGYTKQTYPHPLRSAPANDPPTVTITTPTSDNAHKATASPLASLAGTASDDVSVSSVTWNCDVCGSGTASGTTSWSVSNITLQNGPNFITVTAFDGESQTGTDTILVTLTSGNVYYIDQSAGSDANNGTSPTTPWQDAPGMAAYTGGGSIVAGDYVYFDKADTWTMTGANQGLYLIGGATYIGNLWGSGTRARLLAGNGFNNGAVRFRTHASAATVLRGFDVDGNGEITNGIEMCVCGGQGALTGGVKRVEQSIVHGTYSEQPTTYTYGIFLRGTSDGEVDNVELLNNEIHTTSRDALVLYPDDASGSSIVRNVVVRGNSIHNTSQDPGYDFGAGIAVKGRVIDAIIEYNYVYDADGSSIFINGNETNHYGTGMSNIHIRYNIIEKSNNSTQANLLIYDTNTGDPKDVKIYGNIFLPSAGTLGGLVKDNVNTLTLLVYNNTFYQSWVDFTDTSDTPTITFTNNLIYYTGGVPFSVETAGVASHSDNIYYRGSGTLVAVGGTTYTAATLGTYEATASSADPLFTNAASLPTGFSGSYGTFAPNTNGLSIQTGSFAKNNGATLTSDYANSINSASRPNGVGWDIGAYEFVEGIAFLSDPTGLNLTANSTPTFLSNPTGLSLNANTTPTLLNNPTGLSLSGNANPTFLNNPTGLTLTSP